MSDFNTQGIYDDLYNGIAALTDRVKVLEAKNEFLEKRLAEFEEDDIEDYKEFDARIGDLEQQSENYCMRDGYDDAINDLESSISVVSCDVEDLSNRLNNLEQEG